MAQWWDKEALLAQPSAFPTSPSPSFICEIHGVGFLSDFMDFAAVPPLTKEAALLELWPPPTDSV